MSGADSDTSAGGGAEAPPAVQESPRARRATSWHRAALLGLLVFAGLARWTPARFRSDLAPWPDTPEYVVAARNFAEHGGFFVDVRDQRLPSRYPIGYPSLLVPVYLLFGGTLSNAVYVGLAISLAQITLVFSLAKRLFGGLGGLVAAGLVAISPADVALSGEILSDPASSLFLLAALLALSHVGSPGQKAVEVRSCLLAGGVFGFACWIRQPNLLLMPAYLVLLGLLALGSGRREQWVRAAAAFCAGWLCFQVPLFAYNELKFGGILRSGYNLWMGEIYDDLGKVFSLHNAFGRRQNAAHYLDLLRGVPGKYMYHQVIPLYASVAFPLALLAVVLSASAGLRLVRGLPGHIEPWNDEARGAGRVPLPACCAAAMVLIIAITYAQYSLYFWEAELRLVFLFVPLVAILAAGGLVAVLAQVRWLAEQWHLPPGLIRCGLVGALVVGASWQLWGFVRTGYFWRTVVQKESFPSDFTTHDSYGYMCMRAIDEGTEPDATIVSDHFIYVYVTATEPTRQFIRLRHPDVLPKSVNLPTFAQDPDAVGALIAQGRAVYYVGTEASFERIPQSAPFQLNEMRIRRAFHQVGVRLYRLSMR